MDIKSLAAEYDCRREVEDVLGAPKLKTAKSWAWCCPFHDEKTPSFHVYESHYYCYGCEAKGDVLDFWAWSRNVTLKEILRENSVRTLSPEEKQRLATQQAERAARELEEKIKEAQKALEELKKAQAWIRYHQNLTPETRLLWEKRGIPNEWQDYWKFGYACSCPTYHQSPSLTIPIFTPGREEPLNIRHRLLNPSDMNDKYRPEQAGLSLAPFYGDPDLPIERSDRVIVVEGEIKGAVTFRTIDEPLFQVLGVPGKSAFETVAGMLQGHDGVWIAPDPGAEESWSERAKQAKARLIVLPAKIDDMIIAGQLSKQNIFGMMDQARRMS